MTRALSEGALCLMQLLMADERIGNKVKTANCEKEGKYVIYSIRDSGTVVLGETKYRFWNQLIGCQYKMPFEKWALVVWDALVDLSKGANAKALEEGLSTEIAKKAQRSGDYEWVVKRLYNCYEHVCNNKNDGMSSAGDRDNNGSNANSRTVLVDGQPVVVNINADGLRKQLKFPDATGRAFLKFDVGIVGVNVEKS